MFLGATGPLVAAFLVPDPLTRQQVVATHAAFMPWLPMLALMIALGFMGTLVGRALLDRMPEHRFAHTFKLAGLSLASVVRLPGRQAHRGRLREASCGCCSGRSANVIASPATAGSLGIDMTFR